MAEKRKREDDSTARVSGAAVVAEASASASAATGVVLGAPHAEPGTEISQFLDVLDSFTPTIPDEVVKYYLTRAGFKSSDERVLRLVSLATQKFIADVATDAMEYCKAGQASSSSRSKNVSNRRR